MSINNLWEQQIITVGDVEIRIESFWGSFNNIEYYQARLIGETDEEKKGLLRIGNVHGELAKEQQLREILGPQKFLAPLLGITTQTPPSVEQKGEPLVKDGQESESPVIVGQIVDTEDIENSVFLKEESEEIDEFVDAVKDKEEPLTELNPVDELDGEIFTTEEADQGQETIIETENSASESNLVSNYLAEEIYPEHPFGISSEMEVLLMLTAFPDGEKTLEKWLEQPHPPTEALLVAGQICQLFCLLAHHNWCVLAIAPRFMQMGTPLTVFDLTAIHRLDQPLEIGLQGTYFPPELITGGTLHPHTSTYIVGVILLQALFPEVAANFLAQDFTSLGQYDGPALPLQPKLRQLLTIALAPNPEERFSVEQFLELLIETRTLLTKPHLTWQIASYSTVGLSLHRLHNEDNFGIRQSVTVQSQVLLAAIADGMGGMAQGEVASQLAIDTLINASLPKKINSALERQNWLGEVVNQANQHITTEVRNGGTTLSAVLVVNQQLHIAHVGDSRIYLIRRGFICQLSEDHSLVAMLLNSGQISYQESLEHPDRNVLTKSLGGQRQLNSGHVQTLSHFGQDNYLTLEDGDILLLCSDGVWDLVSGDEMATIFSKAENLQMAVNQTIDQVLERGANDNATLVALQLTMEPPHL